VKVKKEGNVDNSILTGKKKPTKEKIILVKPKKKAK
jgi:hypothetical protein